jgi:glycosyltransferase involved in cell wall biosynthesis
VSNFFYGKGQELISAVCKQGYKSGLKFTKDSAIVFIYNSIKYRYAESFLNNCKNIMKPYKHYFFRDLPREDVVAAFKCSDIFLFTSKKEVSPLVILEAQAAGLPWVSMDVGDIEDRKGGIIVPVSGYDLKGYKCPTPEAIKRYTEISYSIISDRDIRKNLIKSGKEDIKKYDWSNIYSLYDKVFKS